MYKEYDWLYIDIIETTDPTNSQTGYRKWCLRTNTSWVGWNITFINEWDELGSLWINIA